MGVDQLVTGGDVNDPVVDSLTTDDASINAPNGFANVLTVASWAQLIVSDEFTLDDDGTEKIVTDLFDGESIIVWASNVDKNQAVIAAFSGQSSNKLIDATGNWDVSDTDGTNNLFRNTSDNLVLKNRTNSNNQTYRVFGLQLEQ